MGSERGRRKNDRQAAGMPVVPRDFINLIPRSSQTSNSRNFGVHCGSAD
jgi:hypothetical protein